jgi:hypothetical protein
MPKTKNFSVRFDEEKLDFAMKKTGKESPYELVKFLLSEYCKLYRVEKPSVFEMAQIKCIIKVPSLIWYTTEEDTKEFGACGYVQACSMEEDKIWIDQKVMSVSEYIKRVESGRYKQ